MHIVENPVHLLLKLPHQETYAHNILLDAEAYELLQAEGWKYSVSQSQPGRYYVQVQRKTEEGTQRLFLHRWLAFRGHINPGHGYEIHHKDFNGLNNLCENLEPLFLKDHRRLHAQQKKQKQEVVQ